MTTTDTTIDEFCHTVRWRFETWRIEAWALAKAIGHKPSDKEKLYALEQLLAVAITAADNLNVVTARQQDPDTLDWLYWANSFVSRDLAEIRRAYRVAQFHVDPTERTMAAAMGWYSTAKVAAARARLTF